MNKLPIDTLHLTSFLNVCVCFQSPPDCESVSIFHKGPSRVNDGRVALFLCDIRQLSTKCSKGTQNISNRRSTTKKFKIKTINYSSFTWNKVSARKVHQIYFFQYQITTPTVTVSGVCGEGSQPPTINACSLTYRAQGVFHIFQVGSPPPAFVHGWMQYFDKLSRDGVGKKGHRIPSTSCVQHLLQLCELYAGCTVKI